MISLIDRLLLTSLILLFLTLLVFTVKRVMRRHISLRAQYLLWIPPLSLLAMPFVPVSVINPGFLRGLWTGIRLFRHNGAAFGYGNVSEGQGAQLSDRIHLQDFSISISRGFSPVIYDILFLVWMAGVLVMIWFSVRALMKIHQLKKDAVPFPNGTVLRIYGECKRDLNIRRQIPLLGTTWIDTPAATGILRPCILLPLHLIPDLSETEIRHILMHELLHCRHQDTLVHELACLVKIIYWFHPAVWLLLREMNQDCEIACDGDVLDKLGEQDYISYGTTLLHFTARASGLPNIQPLNMGTSGKELRRRILSIKNYRAVSLGKKVKSGGVLLLVAALTFAFTPLVSAAWSPSGSYTWEHNNMEELDLSSYFGTYAGSFVLYDVNRDKFSVYNEKKAGERISPNSTFKIYSALTALQNHVISPEQNKLKWDGNPASFDSWNRDHTLESAMQNSVNWYFNALNQETGLKKLQDTLSAIGYGNEDCSGGLNRFYIESSLKISPMEQVELLARLQQGDLPFDLENIEAVKQALLLSSGHRVSLYGKTGTGTMDGQDINGWFVGFLEGDQGTYIFATNIQGDSLANGINAGDITLNILKNLQLLTD